MNPVPPQRSAPLRAALLLFCALALAGPAALGAQPAAPPAPYDVIVEGGRIVDGTGNAWYYGDLAVRDGRIARIGAPGSLADLRADERIDASGLVVAPGFIDIQSHSRYALLHGDGRVVSKVSQGITTEIMGEGTTNAPLNPVRLRLEEVEDSVQRRRLESFSGPRAFDAWLRAMESHGASVNFGSFLGGSTLRIYARGHRAGAPRPAQVDTMRAVTRRAMEDGAFGIATALIYPPGNYATTGELVEAARAMAPYGGLYITHLRSEGDRLLEAMDEAMRIGQEGGVPVEIFHLKAAGRRNWKKAEAAVAKIDSARAAGLDVQADMYPYAGASTSLAACLPPSASEGGNLDARLRGPETRREIADEIRRGSDEWENLCELAGPEGVLLLGLREPENERWVGARLADVAEARGTDWVDAMIDLVLSEEGRIGTIYFLMSEENVRFQLRQPWMKFGTDAGGVNPRAGLGRVHPRAYGTFPRILGRYVREEGVLPLEEAVRKSTSAVATRLSIEDRGQLTPGFHADVVVFDPATVGDRATYEEPHQVSTGIRHVLVNGVPVIRDGEHTGARPGRIVRGPGYRPELSEPTP